MAARAEGEQTAFALALGAATLEKGNTIGGTAMMAGTPNAQLPVRITLELNGVVVAEVTTTTGVPFTFNTTTLAVGTYTVRAQSPANAESPLQACDATLIIEQHGKAWTTGDGIAGGQMTAPQNKTVAPAAPLNVVADPNQKVSCAVSAATDFDTWTKGTNTGDEADGVTYRWTASGGRFSGGVSGAATTWIAPEEPGTYSLTCTVDDLPTEVIAPDTGTRNDSPLTSTVTIKVPPKAWVADSAIGVQEIETIVNGAPVIITVNSGRITAPQNQKDADITKWKPKKVLAVIGSFVSCTIESATDEDRWTQGTLKGEESDDVPDANYKWTGGDGVTSGFFDRWETDANGAILLDADGKPVPHLVTEKAGRSVSFRVSKTEDVTEAVTCTISDSPKAVIFPDTGTRDDADLVRSVSVKTYNPTSFATLKLYRTDATKTDSLGAEITGGAAGGTIKAVLEVQVGGRSSVADGSKSVRLRLEESDARHAEGNAAVKDAAGVVTKAGEAGENHTNLAVSLDGTWQMWNGMAWTGAGSPAAANDTGTPRKYRTILDWNTTTEQSYADPDADGPLFASRLLGHNGPHRAVIYKSDAEEDKEIGFQTKDGDDVYGEEKAGGPLPVGVDVENLAFGEVTSGQQVVTNATADYFKFDPDSADTTFQHPVIRFKIEDSGDSHQYKWKLCIRPTWFPYAPEVTFPNSPYAFIEGIADGPGVVTATWNGGRINNTGDLAETDTYAFDIYLEEITSGTLSVPVLDKIQLRTPYSLKMVEHTVQVNDNLSESVIEVTYRLIDAANKDAALMKVDVIRNSDLQFLGSTVVSGTVNVDHAPTPVYTVADDVIDVRAIFTAEDGHANERRDHKNGHMLAINKAVGRNVLLFLDSTSIPSLGNIKTDDIAKAYRRALLKISWTNNFALDWSESAGSPGGLPHAGFDYGLAYHYTRGVTIYERSITESSKMPAKSEEVYRKCILKVEPTLRSGWNLPGKLGYSISGLAAVAGDGTWTAAQLKIPIANTIIHELGHVLGSTTTATGIVVVTQHCDDKTCIMYPEWRGRMDSSFAPTWWLTRGSKHEKDHLDRIRRNMNLDPIPQYGP